MHFYFFFSLNHYWVIVQVGRWLYYGPLLFLFERTYNNYFDLKGLVLWRLRRLEKPGGAILYHEVWGGGQSKPGENGLFVQGMQGETQVVQFLGKCGAKV